MTFKKGIPNSNHEYVITLNSYLQLTGHRFSITCESHFFRFYSIVRRIEKTTITKK